MILSCRCRRLRLSDPSAEAPAGAEGGGAGMQKENPFLSRVHGVAMHLSGDE